MLSVLEAELSSEVAHADNSTAMLINSAKDGNNFFILPYLENDVVNKVEKLELQIFQHKLTNSLHQNLYNKLYKYYIKVDISPIL